MPPEIRVRKGRGLGTSCRACSRKKASWRASTARIDAGPWINPGSEAERPEIMLMTPPMPVEVMTLESSRNSSALSTGNMYLHGSKVVLLKCLRIFSAV